MATAFNMTRPVFMRQIPDDFVEIYLQIGWDGIEDHYRAHKLTIKRWITECGGDDLKQRRRDAVKAKRFHAQRQHLQRGGEVRVDLKPPAPEIVSAAAHFLRHPDGGGWRVFPTERGDWFVGINRKSAGEVVAMAVGKGFDAEAAGAIASVDTAARDARFRRMVWLKDEEGKRAAIAKRGRAVTDRGEEE